MELKEYIQHYVKAKDAFYKRLKGHDDRGDHILFEFTAESVPYYISDKLSDVDVHKLKDIPKKFIVCLNTLENVRYLIDNWQVYAQIQGLIIMFANPNINEKWLINTALHAKVTEPQDIEQGLLTLFNNIPSV
jgi:hypothetical protein